MSDGIARGELCPFNVRPVARIPLSMISPFFDVSNERELGASDDALTLLMTIFFDGCAC